MISLANFEVINSQPDLRSALSLDEIYQAALDHTEACINALEDNDGSECYRVALATYEAKRRIYVDLIAGNLPVETALESLDFVTTRLERQLAKI